ncbi:MAG: beta-propeller domain-containing protein [Myxococcota bacterium]
MLWASACLPPGALDSLFDFEQTEMANFASCSQLESSLKQRALAEAQYRSLAAITSSGSYNPGGYTATGATDLTDKSVSTTNNQEDGVDEADILKVDGDYVYALHGSALVIVEALRDENVRTINSARQVSWTQIEGQPFEMFVAGDRALIMLRTNHSEVQGTFSTSNEDVPERADDFKLVKAALYDITDRSAPKLMRELFVEGDYLSSRRIGDRSYIVTKAMLDGPPIDDTPSSDATWLSRREAAINNAKLSDWIPYYYDVRYDAAGNTTLEASNCSCDDTYAAPSGEGDDALAVYSISLESGDSSIETTTIIGDGATVYSSRKSLVVALTNYAELTYGDAGRPTFTGGPATDEDPQNSTGQVTTLHHFELSDSGKVRYDASGQVDGWILNQFSLSEHNGTLRVATQLGYNGDPDVQTLVFTLRAGAKPSSTFTTAGGNSQYLKVLGELRGIGYGEDLYAVRFKGDVGYVVTFLETDPLWTIDLSDPSSPKILGELMVPGYSTYLHPIDGGRIIGVGRADWTDDEGIKLSLFDVSDLSRPTAIQERAVGDINTTSPVEETHKAFLWLEDLDLMAIPLDSSSYASLGIYKVENGFVSVAVLDHGDLRDSGSGFPSILRSQRIGDYLYAYSRAGISISRLSDFATAASVDLDDI